MNLTHLLNIKIFFTGYRVYLGASVPPNPVPGSFFYGKNDKEN